MTYRFALGNKVKQLGQRGVTLVEMLITMGLFAVFLVVIATVFTSALDVQNQTDSYSSVAAESRFVMARINQDIARSAAISTPATLGASSGTLVMTVSAATYTYALNGTRLQLTDGTGTDFITGDGVSVSGLSFQRIGNAGGKESVRYSFTLTSVAKNHAGISEVQTFTSTVERR